MAYADFNEDYRNRTSGLAAWLQSLAAPSQPTPPALPVAGPVDFGSQNPNDKAISLAQEAFQPGSADIQPSHAAAPEPAFRDSTFGQILGGMMPNTVGRVFESQRGKALADYAQNMPSDPLEAIQGMMKINPQAAQQYIPELMAAAKNEPEIKSRKALQEYFKSLVDQGGLSPKPNAPDFGAPSHEFDTGLAPPPPVVDQGVPLSGAMAPIPGFKDPVPVAIPGVQGPPSPLQAFDKYPAQTMAESGGNPNAVSPAGAMGLKQLMPATAADPGFGISPAKDGSPAENMRVGNEYMDAMLKKYNGNVPLALAGYNWGPGATDKWISEGADPAKLPPETAAYIKKLAPTITAQTSGKPAPSALAAFDNHLTPEEGMALKVASLDPKYTDNMFAAFGRKNQAVPYTTAGKAQADYEHGLITAQQRDQMATGTGGLEDLGLTGPDAMNYLQQNNKGLAADVKLALAGKYPMTSMSSRNQHTLDVMRAASMVDSSFDPTRYQERLNTAKAYAPQGDAGKQFIAMGTAASHLADAYDAFKELNNSGIPLVGKTYNEIANWVAQQGDSKTHDALAKFDTAINVAAPELTKIASGKTNISEGEIKQWRDRFNHNISPGAMDSTFAEAASIIQGRAEPLVEAYKNVMGDKKPPTLQPFSKRVIDLFSGMGADLSKVNEAASLPEDGIPDNPAAPAPDMAALQAAAAAELAKRGGG